jgi:ABC-2 type transport system permease protein
MSTVTNTDSLGPGMQDVRAQTSSRTRPFYWSLRREIWEHRAIYIAPLAVAGLVLFGYLIRLSRLPQAVRHAATLPWWKQYLEIALPFAIAMAAVLVTGAIVGVFYCIGALGNERRDRSILFWKSLPVSDLTTVLAKATIPMVIIPVVVTIIALCVQFVMLAAATGALAANGSGTQVLWSHWSFAHMSLTLIYLVVTGTLWYAPIYGWLLMVSAWARRMTFLWAVLVPVGLAVVERIAFDTGYVWSLIRYRLKGFVDLAFVEPPRNTTTIDPAALMTPAHYFASPGLWIGLVVAAAFFAAAVWLRRGREPA